MVNWDKYGLGEWQETFESMGIQSVGDLIDLAPSIENDLGLDGLCEALGIRNPEKEKKEREKREEEERKRTIENQKKNTGKTKGSSGTGHLYIEDIIAGFFIKILIGIVILGILMVAGIGFGHYVGLIKNTMYVNVTASPEKAIETENVSVKLVSQTNAKNIVHSQVAEDGRLMLKAKYDRYDMYLVYDGEEFLYYTWEINFASLADANLDIDVSNFFLRPVMVRFSDANGNVVHPETINVESSAGFEVNCTPVNEELYVMHLINQAEGVVLTLEADSYKPVEISSDWNAARICLVEVTLEHEE